MNDPGFQRTIGKAKPTATDFMEIGSSGLIQYGGQVREDFLRQLQGRRGVENYREMADNDPVVGAILHACEMMIRGVDWSIDAADVNDPVAADYAEFVASCLTDMSTSWDETLGAILSFLTYGFSVHEIVYKRREGRDSKSPSKHNDGRIGWKKLPIRGQSTIYDWDIDANGGINGVTQEQELGDTYGRNNVYIPIEKMLLFRTTTKYNNPRGRSILRNAFLPWYYKTKIQEIEAIGIERDLAGLPVAMVPPQLLSDNATQAESAALDAIKELVRNIKRDEQEGIVFPLAYDPDTGNLAYDLKLLSTGGRRQFDTNAIIQRYDQRIAMSTLADFILLGHQATGTQALSVSKIELFISSMSAWLDAISEVFNSYAIPRLIRLNGMDESKLPQLNYTPPKNVDLAALGTFINQLAGAGAPLFPDEQLENYLRQSAGLPAQDAEDV
ncbi:MAG: phage portal protein family protein [Pirellulales bacterium]